MKKVTVISILLACLLVPPIIHAQLPFIVRTIYFKSVGTPDAPEKIKTMMKQTQQFYLREMEQHGYGLKTFRIENDNNEVVVHTVVGKRQPAAYTSYQIIEPELPQELRILNWLSKLYPITHVCVEDIKARTIAYAKKWNKSFSPLEVGKQWFYAEVEKRWHLSTLQGWETQEIRDSLGLKKSSNKRSETFAAHCVDSWCLAYHTVGGKPIVENTSILCISPIPIRRRELHRQNPQKGGKRPRYGGTRCLGVAKNTLVRHVEKGLLRVTGHQKGCLTLSEVHNSKQVVLTAKPTTYKILKKLNFRYS